MGQDDAQQWWVVIDDRPGQAWGPYATLETAAIAAETEADRLHDPEPPDIIAMLEQGMSPGEIVARCPSLRHDDVSSAIQAHRDRS